jgi:hypothetical protein
VCCLVAHLWCSVLCIFDKSVESWWRKWCLWLGCFGESVGCVVGLNKMYDMCEVEDDCDGDK